VCIFYYPSAHEAAGALGTRHSRAPSSFQGEEFKQASGAIRAAGILIVVPAKAGTHTP